VISQVKAKNFIQHPILQHCQSDANDLSCEASRTQYLFNFRNIRVDTLTGLVVLDSGFIVDSTLANWQKIIYRGGIGSSVKRTKKTKKKLSGAYIVMPHSPFFFHAVIDELPNLILARSLNLHCNNVLVHSITPKWTIELLEYFGFNVHSVHEKALIVEELFAVSAPRAIIRKNLDLLRENVVTNPSDILIVSRRGAPRSDSEIEEAINARVRNSILVDPGQFTVHEQIRMFSRAKIIIGLHGGALTNCVWMNSSGTVVEIFNHTYRTSDYQRICLEIGLKYVQVEARNLGADQVAQTVESLLYDN
jgi:capsular polysaccharide biosynthesis protein